MRRLSSGIFGINDFGCRKRFLQQSQGVELLVIQALAVLEQLHNHYAQGLA